uniref:uncharacterized protein LOC104266126 n=1 Tax=Ciona intestinalis TaxID=7719 RepID=UPI00089DAAD4|nr:uncharacterized protein LOC104266126 [Ciona intestinalis]|eukprot:XP_018672368.1 uncharacterized protein LOC104266126 [Ciona intestinalis]
MNGTVQFCLMRWNNIRSTYARKHKKSTEVPSGSASQAPETWPYFKQLHFLDSYIKHRRTKDNFLINEEAHSSATNITQCESPAVELEDDMTFLLDSEPADSPQTVMSTETEPSKKRQKKSTDSSFEIQSQMLNVLQKSSNRLENLSTPSTLDKFDHFAAFVASELRSKPPNIVAVYILQITNILYSDITPVTTESL